MRRTVTALPVMVLVLALVLAGVPNAYADGGTETVITFDDLSSWEPIHAQYAGLGVTFNPEGGAFYAWRPYAATSTYGRIPIGRRLLVAAFDQTVNRVSFLASTWNRYTATFLDVAVYKDGVLQDVWLGLTVPYHGGDWSTWGYFSFEHAGGFDRIEITKTGRIVAVDNFAFVIAKLLPTGTEECKKDGWRGFGVFKNQGDCVSFVASGARNQPDGE